MVGRLAVLGALLAALPFSVDLPGDSARARTTVEAAAGGGQFALVSRGCNGEVTRVTRNHIASGALVVEQPLPRQWVVGIRAGSARTTLHPAVTIDDPSNGVVRDSTFTDRYSNPYVNPYACWEGRSFGIGAGLMMADRPLLMGEGAPWHARTTWHVRVSSDDRSFTLRWLEDVPLESEGHLSADLAYRPFPRVETALFGGLFGPFDGAMLGVRGRVWFTPDAAAQVKAGVTGQYGEFGVYGSVTARLPVAR